MDCVPELGLRCWCIDVVIDAHVVIREISQCEILRIIVKSALTLISDNLDVVSQLRDCIFNGADNVKLSILHEQIPDGNFLIHEVLNAIHAGLILIIGGDFRGDKSVVLNLHHEEVHNGIHSVAVGADFSHLNE